MKLLNEVVQSRPATANPAAETGAGGKAGAPSVWKRFLTALRWAFASAAV
jgi:hypothetical protein